MSVATVPVHERRQSLDHREAPATFFILTVAALIGRELLQLLGINLGAFGVVGGIVVSLMGGMLLATIGTQLALGGIRTFCEF